MTGVTQRVTRGLTPRATEERLADVLSDCMRRPSYRVTAGLLGRMSGVSKATVVNWRDGRVARPRRWQDVVRVADALRLGTVDTDRLLRAAGQPTLAQLAGAAHGNDARLLAAWTGPQPVFDDEAISDHFGGGQR